jgi:hypothetical protein
MTPNHWWLRLIMPTAVHMFWLGDSYDNETGFADLITQASQLVDFPDNWVDREDGPWNRSLSEDPHPSLYDGATVHEQGWADVEAEE